MVIVVNVNVVSNIHWLLEGKTLKEDQLDDKASALRDHFVAMIADSRQTS